MRSELESAKEHLAVARAAVNNQRHVFALSAIKSADLCIGQVLEQLAGVDDETPVIPAPEKEPVKKHGHKKT